MISDRGFDPHVTKKRPPLTLLDDVGSLRCLKNGDMYGYSRGVVFAWLNSKMLTMHGIISETNVLPMAAQCRVSVFQCLGVAQTHKTGVFSMSSSGGSLCFF